MTEEKCYSLEKDGTFCLGFPNRYALSEKEIEEIFSEYGSVISVRTSGDERGFRFVRYKTLEEAEKAIEGLNGNKKIRILPKKPKNQNANDKGSSKENQKNGPQKSYQKKGNQNSKDDDMNNSFIVEHSPVTQFTTYKKVTPYGGVYNTRSINSFDNAKNKENVIVNGERENLMKLLRLRATRGVVANNFGSDSASIFDEETVPKFQDFKKEGSQSPQNKNQKKDDDDDAFRIDHPFAHKSVNQQESARYNGNSKAKVRSDVAEFLDKFTNGDDEQLLKRFKQRSMRLRASNFGSDLASTFGEEKTSKCHDVKFPVDDEPPELVSTEEFKQRSVKGSVCGDEVVKTIPAEEVIVANVHQDFSELYILYLLEKFEPISITEMKTIPKKGIRYCSVYFKSTEDAIAVEKQFDDFNLSGNKLIVRTPQLLVSEVGTA